MSDESKFDVLVDLLKKVAVDPDTSFPPRPDAPMVKVTPGALRTSASCAAWTGGSRFPPHACCRPDCAFSAQPTEQQFRGLKEFGIASVLNLSAVTPCDPESSATMEAKACKDIGIPYVHVPPLEVSCRSAEVCCRAAFDKIGSMVDSASRSAGITTQVIGIAAGSGAGESGDGGAAVKLDRTDLSYFKSFAELAASDPATEFIRGEATQASLDKTEAGKVWSASWAKHAVKELNRLPKPVLVHSQTGLAACAVALLRAALAARASSATVRRWSADLGHDLGKARADLLESVESVLTEAEDLRSKAKEHEAATVAEEAGAAVEAATETAE